jgi:hypothetical protein
VVFPVPDFPVISKVSPAWHRKSGNKKSIFGYEKRTFLVAIIVNEFKADKLVI